MFSVVLIQLLAAGSCVYSIDLIQPDSVVVQPGQSLTILCQVSGYALTDNSYATGWIRQREGKPMDWILHRWGGGSVYQNDALKNKFLHHTLTSTSSVKLTGQNLQPDDTAVYYCVRAQWYSWFDWGGADAFDYWGKGTMVTVTSATSKGPIVFPLMPCGSGTGDMVSLGCFATGFTPSSLTFTWNKNGTALTDFTQYPPVQKDNYYMGVSQIRVSRQDWDKREIFQCAVAHVAGKAQTSHIIKPLDFYQPPILKVLASSNDEKEASFSCFAKDFSPKDYDIKWLKGGEEINNKIYEIKTQTATKLENGTKLYSAASFLTVPSHDLPSHTQFTCEFKGKKDKIDVFTNSSVLYNNNESQGCNAPDVEIEIEGPKVEDLFLHGNGTITCQVKENKLGVDKIFWEDQYGNEMTGALQGPFNGKPLSLPLDISYDEWNNGVKRNCVVEHKNFYDPFKKLYERNTGGETQRPSVFMLPPVEHTRTETVTLTCYVKDFFPHEVFVSWLVDDEAASDSKYKFSTTNPVKNNGSYSAYGQLSLGLDEWKNNNMVYSCVVYHQSVVNNIKAIVRSIGQRTSENTNLVNLNMNIPETCKAH